METITIHQKWEGLITDVTPTSLWARLYDLQNKTAPEEIVEIPLKEITTTEQKLVRPGAVFYWNIGETTSETGEVSSFSEIKIPKPEVWTKEELTRIEKKASETFTRMSKNENRNKI